MAVTGDNFQLSAICYDTNAKSLGLLRKAIVRDVAPSSHVLLREMDTWLMINANLEGLQSQTDSASQISTRPTSQFSYIDPGGLMKQWLLEDLSDR